MKKYDFTGKTKIVDGVKVRQIVRLKDNLLGGWIEKEGNLLKEGNCFVFDDAVVYGNATVYGNAKILNSAKVCGSSTICGNAIIFDKARVYGNTKIYDNASIYGNAQVFGNAKVYSNGKVYGNAYISYGDIIGEVQTSFDDISFYKSVNTRLITAITKDNKTLFNIGCQKLITKEEFINIIHNEDGGLKKNPHRKFYLKVLELY